MKKKNKTQATNKVIVLGTSHYNTIGMVQCLGDEGLYVIVVVVGSCGLLSKSVFVKEIYEVESYDNAIIYIADNLVDTEKTVIFPCGDEAALKLDKYYEKLKEHFLFQHSVSSLPISYYMNKNIQVEIANECGIDVPTSHEVNSVKQITLNLDYPIIVKPLVSCEGDKRDICVVKNEAELSCKIKELLEYTPRVIVQQFIKNRDKELNILGCSLNNGSCIIPLSIEKLRIHPKGTGSVSVGLVTPFESQVIDLIPKIERMIQKIGYVGLFSFEFIVDKQKKSIYFIELNLRNDALNPFIFKGGVNLPYLHYLDLTGRKLKEFTAINKPKKMICEPIHMASLHRKTISPFVWLKDILTSSSFMLYHKKDKRLFYQQFVNKLFR